MAMDQTGRESLQGRSEQDPRRRLRQQAEELRAKAEEATTSAARLGYLELAQQWRRVAERKSFSPADEDRD